MLTTVGVITQVWSKLFFPTMCVNMSCHFVGFGGPPPPPPLWGQGSSGQGALPPWAQPLMSKPMPLFPPSHHRHDDEPPPPPHEHGGHYGGHEAEKEQGRCQILWLVFTPSEQD